MKQLKNNKKHTLKFQLQMLRMMILGSKMAKISSVILIVATLAAAVMVRDHLLYSILLIIGALVLVWYMVNYLSTNGINPKEVSKNELENSISKLKSYVSNRKKYEAYVFAFWLLTLVPVILYKLDFSPFIGLAIALLLVVSPFFVTSSAFKQIDKNIEDFESVIDNTNFNQIN